jgi:hypothetical protein
MIHYTNLWQCSSTRPGKFCALWRIWIITWCDLLVILHLAHFLISYTTRCVIHSVLAELRYLPCNLQHSRALSPLGRSCTELISLWDPLLRRLWLLETLYLLLLLDVWNVMHLGAYQNWLGNVRYPMLILSLSSSLFNALLFSINHQIRLLVRLHVSCL